MSKVDDLKSQIEGLADDDFAELVKWLGEKDWQRWDRQIEDDSRSGRLDFLIGEALDEKTQGTLGDL